LRYWCRAAGVRTAGETLRILFRAEASKIMLMVFLLWLVLSAYQEVVPVMFFGRVHRLSAGIPGSFVGCVKLESN